MSRVSGDVLWLCEDLSINLAEQCSWQQILALVLALLILASLQVSVQVLKVRQCCVVE